VELDVEALAPFEAGVRDRADVDGVLGDALGLRRIVLGPRGGVVATAPAVALAADLLDVAEAGIVVVGRALLLGPPPSSPPTASSSSSPPREQAAATRTSATSTTSTRRSFIVSPLSAGTV
jgi:hypothetical protein